MAHTWESDFFGPPQLDPESISKLNLGVLILLHEFPPFLPRCVVRLNKNSHCFQFHRDLGHLLFLPIIMVQWKMASYV